MIYFNVAGEKDRSYKGVKDPYSALANVANNYVDNQFEFFKDILFGTTKAKIARENEAARVQNALNNLSNQQKYVLDLKLQAAKNEAEKQKIFADTLTALSGQRFELSQKSNLQTGLIVIGGAVLLFGAILLFKRKS